MAYKTKAESTPEEWAAWLAHQRKTRRAWKLNNPEAFAGVAARARVREQQPEYVEKRRVKFRERYAKPEIRERIKQQQNTPEARAKRAENAAKKKYGVSIGFVRTLVALQGNRCAVCGRFLAESKHTHLDHCHDTNRVRGLLCSPCNHAEGMIRKIGLPPSEFAKRLEAYLAEPPASIVELV